MESLRQLDLPAPADATHSCAERRSLKGRLTGLRALRMALRTLHIAAAAVTLGAAIFGQTPEPWGGLLLGSGLAMVLLDVRKLGWDWLRYVQGASVLLKLALVALGLAWSPALLPGLWAALVVGSLVSHAPGSIRHAALWGPAGPCAGSESAAPPPPHRTQGVIR